MTELAVEAQVHIKEKSKTYYDQKREFAVGGKVLVLLPEDSMEKTSTCILQTQLT